MKKKLALLMAAIMTVAMVPMTAFASTKLTAVDEISTAVDKAFETRVELSKNDDQVDVPYKDGDSFDVYLTLTNGKFTKTNDKYDMETKFDNSIDRGIKTVKVLNDTKAVISIDGDVFNGVHKGTVDACVLTIRAKAVETGDVVATFTSNVTQFKKASEVIATAYADKVAIAIEKVKTVVEDSDDEDNIELEDITIDGLVNKAISANGKITLKLKGNYTFKDHGTVSFLNDSKAGFDLTGNDDTITIQLSNVDQNKLTKMTISGIVLKAEKKCSAGDVATITVSSKDFDSVKLEVAKMVEEAVTYTVEDKDLPTFWAGKDYAKDEKKTLKVSVEENTGDILNTSRKATFTFPEGIEVVDIDTDGSKLQTEGKYAFTYSIDENVVTIKNYSVAEGENKTDLDVKFIINAAPTFTGDVTVKLGGEFDDVEFKVATVKAPYTVEAKTSEVLIDYRYVPVNEIVITEAEDGLLEEDDVIVLEVEKMDFEDAGSYEVTEGDIDVKVDVDTDDKKAQLKVTVKDESTEASTIVISGLELYLDRTLPVGGYALTEVKAGEGEQATILWENSTDAKVGNKDKIPAKECYDYVPDAKEASNGLFKLKDITINDSYVEVVTQARDQDDYTTNRKIVITIGATTMAVGTETVTLDAPAYINAENYTELPLRAVSEAFGATVAWDDASRTVTVMMGQRIVSMTIGSKTMYINGTPVAMNTAPEITADRTFVPVRDLANALGISKIDWNEAAATVTLN